MARVLLPTANMKDLIHILFVEDDSEMSEIYKEGFSAPDFSVSTAMNGQEALSILEDRREDFDVIVTDNNMPEMSGLTLLKALHEKFARIKVVVVTGYGNWSDYVNADDLGVSRFFDKPVKIAKLREAIRGICA